MFSQEYFDMSKLLAESAGMAAKLMESLPHNLAPVEELILPRGILNSPLSELSKYMLDIRIAMKRAGIDYDYVGTLKATYSLSKLLEACASIGKAFKVYEMPAFIKDFDFCTNPERERRHKEFNRLFDYLGEIKTALNCQNLKKAKYLIHKNFKIKNLYLETTIFRRLSRNSVLAADDELRQDFFTTFIELYLKVNDMDYSQLMEINGDATIWFRNEFYAIHKRKFANTREPFEIGLPFNEEFVYQESKQLPHIDLQLIQKEFRAALEILYYETRERLNRLNSKASQRRLKMIDMLLANGHNLDALKKHFHREDIRRLKEDLRKANKRTGLIYLEGRQIEIALAVH